MKSGHQPQRTCIGCGAKNFQREMLRLAVVDGAPVYDALGKLPGRGAYLCRQRPCVEVAVKRRAAARALKVRASATDSWQTAVLSELERNGLT